MNRPMLCILAIAGLLTAAAPAAAVDYSAVNWVANGVDFWDDAGFLFIDGTGTHTPMVDPVEGVFERIQAPSKYAGVIGSSKNADTVDFDQPGGWTYSARVRMVDTVGGGNLFATGFALEARDDNRLADDRIPAIGVDETSIHYTHTANNTFSKIADLDATSAFHEYTLRYNATTGNYEYLVDGALQFTQPRPDSPPGDNLNGIRVGRVNSGGSTAHTYDISSVTFSGNGLGVLYTFEGDSGATVTDKLLAEGPQDPTVNGSVAVDTDPANAAFGNASISFPQSPSSLNSLDIPGTQSLGKHFTLAAMVSEVDNDFSRLFSVYNGGGPAADELILDIDPSLGPYGFGVRAFVHGTGVVRDVNFADNNYHHVAMTYNDGEVRLFLDGAQLGAAATVPGGNVNLFNNLRFGEDYPPTSQTNEPFEGHADDILVYDQPLAPTQIQALAQNGASAYFSGPHGVLYTFEGDSGTSVTDKLVIDGMQNPTFTGSVVVDTDPANAAFGSSSVALAKPAGSTLEIADSSFLGSQFTLAAFVKADENDVNRLFSNYSGGGPIAANELLMDFDPSGNSIYLNGLRAVLDGVQIKPNVPVRYADGEYHHLAMTYDDGQVNLYVDGVKVARGAAGSGPVNTVANLLVGEDRTVNVDEQLVGNVDDLLILRNQVLSPAEMFTLAFRGVEGAAADPSPILSGTYYNGEPGIPGGGSGDKLIDDGPQNAILNNNVTLNSDPANARFGSGSFAFGTGGPGQWNTIEIPDSAQLGEAFTLAAWVDDEDNDFTRLFSTYVGTGAADPGELIFDFDPSGNVLPGLRGIVNGVVLTAPASFADDEWHHLAMTYDDGVVRLYLDGEDVGGGLAGTGPVNLIDNLHFGEDLGGTANEQLVGFADEILFLREALGPEAIAALAEGPYLAVVPEPASIVLMAFGLIGLAALARKRRK